MDIVFQDSEKWIVCKPPELVSESTPKRDGLADLLAEQNGGYAGVIHRLDRGVGGLMLYAKTPAAAAKYTAMVQNGSLRKEYVALLAGEVPPTGELRDLLYYDRSRNKVFPVQRERRGVKNAILQYRLEKSGQLPGVGHVSLVSVLPVTGRTHQIRVQFASRKTPIIGDRTYGGPAFPTWTGGGKILLACYRLTLSTQEGETVFARTPSWIDPLSDLIRT